MVEMVSDSLVPLVFYVSLEAGVAGASRFADVEFGAFGAMNNVHDVRLAVELFGDVHLGFRSFDDDVGADEGARFAFLLVAKSGSWCSGGWLPKFRSHLHVSDNSVSFVCDQWWSAKDLGHLSACLQETPVRQDLGYRYWYRLGYLTIV